MGDYNISVSRDLLRSALIDAIDWTESLIHAGNPSAEDRKRLAKYKRALNAVGGPRREPAGRAVPVQDLPLSDHCVFPE